MMTTHWWHVAISYALVLGGFTALALAATVRHAQAKRLLASLETRRGKPPAPIHQRGELDRMPQQ